MTKIFYYSAKKDNINNLMMNLMLWGDVVPGGQDEVEKRKKEIQKEHAECRRFCPNLFPEPMFYDKAQVNDYLEFEI